MGILDYRTPATPISSSYLDFYRNYRAPAYQQQFAPTVAEDVQTQAAKAETTAQGYATPSSGGDGQSPSGYSSNQGWGGMEGSQAITGTAANSSNLGNLGGLLGAAFGFAAGGPAGALSGYNTGSKVGGMIGKGAEAMDQSNTYANAIDAGKGEEGSTGRQHGASAYGLSSIANAMAQMDAQAAENDAQSGAGGYSAFGDSSLAGDVAGGSWGGSADSDGWKNGGMIRNKRGLLDGADTSMKNSAPHRGLLQGPITKERDNLPAVNKTTGEKIAVESGEFVMTRKAVKKKGAKFFEKINKEAEGK